MSQGVEGYVTLAPDGAGKSVRNQVFYVQQPDGTIATVYCQETLLVDPATAMPVRPVTHDQAAKIVELLSSIDARLRALSILNGGL